MTRPWFRHSRDPALLERDLERHRRRHPLIFPQLEATPDLSRGETRFAAEVALAELTGGDVPSFAHERAIDALGRDGERLKGETGMRETVALHGEGAFPLAIHAKGEIPNLADAAARYHQDGKHGFGITREGSAAALRSLADQIDAGMVIPQELIDATKATVDDFTLRTLTFTFGVKHESKV